MTDYRALVKAMTREEVDAYDKRLEWIEQARPKQRKPKHISWFIWLLLAGRGFGKTRPGAEESWWWAWTLKESRIAVIAPTSGDLERVCFEGESGLIACMPSSIIRRYVKKPYPTIELVNGSQIFGYTAEAPDRLRGPQHARGWGDEIAAWPYLQETYDNLMFGLRLPPSPQLILTSTPKPLKLLRELKSRDGNDVVVTVGSTFENKDNLAKEFIKEIGKYEGTRIGRQELYAEILDDNEDSIFKRNWFEMWLAEDALPEFDYVVQSYDTAFTEKTSGDKTAFTAWGIFYHHEMKCHCALLLDAWGEHLSFPDLREKAIKEYDSKYGPSERRVDVVLIEDKGSGISLRQELQLAGIPVMPYNPGKADKQQRAHSISHIVHGGRVFIPESSKREGQFCSWADDFIEEVCNFPMEQMADDYVDSFTQAILLLSRQTWLQEIDRGDDINFNEPVINPYMQ